jgi:NAD(P)-dependent dehydrogenase (short-subunit alcohol dehydrogenase family)
MTRWVMDDAEVLPVVLDRIPMARAGRPEEVAAVAVMLLADEAGYVTGQCLYVDGGFIVQ